MDADSMAIYTRVLRIEENTAVTKLAAVTCAICCVLILMICGYWTLRAWSIEGEIERKASQMRRELKGVK